MHTTGTAGGYDCLYFLEGEAADGILGRGKGDLAACLLCFAVFHLYQLTFNGDPEDCYNHIVRAFQNPFCSIFYIIAILCLFMHVRHGVQSVLQTFGLATRKVRPLYNIIAILFGLIVCGGFIAIPVCVMTGVFGLAGM